VETLPAEGYLCRTFAERVQQLSAEFKQTAARFGTPDALWLRDAQNMLGRASQDLYAAAFEMDL
jgi:hypothetical protein